METRSRPHGRFLAGEVGELVGVSGTTIGQWARRGYIRASQSAGDPHVYAVEDVLEAATVKALLDRGVARAPLRRVVAALGGEWPLSDARLATTAAGRRPQVVLREDDGCAVLGPRGWQRLATPTDARDVRPRLVRTPATTARGRRAR